MNRYLHFSLMLLLSPLVYLAVFQLATKPVTVGLTNDLMDWKLSYAHSVDGQKLVIAGGSNSFNSLRCSVLEDIIERPCVNTATQIHLGMDIILAHAKKAASPGDVVLAPLEIRLYHTDPIDFAEYGRAPFVVQYEPELIPELGLRRTLFGLFFFDLRYLAESLAEKIFYARGMRLSAANPSNLSPQGDLLNRTRKGAERFQESLAEANSSLSTMEEITGEGESLRDLQKFLAWAANHDVLVIGTLGVSFDSDPVDREKLDLIRNQFESSGQLFLDLSNLAQYPRTCFYNTNEHLHEECADQHSDILGRELAELLETQGWPGQQKKHVGDEP